MRSLGDLQRIGVESTGSYGAGLLRFMQQAGVAVLEVTTPDKQDRRRRGKNDDLDAQNAAHAAFAGQRTVTPRSRDGMIESLRVLVACRKTAVAARRVALQMIQNTIVCAPDGLRDHLRNMTRMQLIRTLASWRPDLTAYRDVESAYRISFKSLGRRYLELHDEIADLDAMIGAIVDELAPNLVARNSIGQTGAAQLLLTAGENPERLRSEASFAAPYVASVPSRPRQEKPSGIVSIPAAIAPPIARCTLPPSVVCAPTKGRSTTSLVESLKGIPNSTPFEP
jgi:transposase